MPIISNALTLEDLPPPSLGKSGWPWTEQSQPLPDRMPDGSEWPRISIVTPNYNQGQFLEETIRSVLLQGYPNLEYIIIDGGSTDNSVEIIKKYEPYLAYWVSERDRGQSHGINKGFERCTGDYIAWMNSSDCYMPNALQNTFIEAKQYNPDLIYGCAYTGNLLNEKPVLVEGKGTKVFALKYLLRFFCSIEYIIPSQSIFVSKKILKKVGLLNENLHYWMDLDWLARIALEKPVFYRNRKPICFYRIHNEAKTVVAHKAAMNPHREEGIQIAQKYAKHLPPSEKKKLHRLLKYANEYEAYRLGLKQQNLISLIKTMITLPLETLTDRRFLGMLKKSILQYGK
jgi:glycosyltransferase involved in cell wall biosynthesis